MPKLSVAISATGSRDHGAWDTSERRHSTRQGGVLTIRKARPRDRRFQGVLRSASATLLAGTLLAAVLGFTLAAAQGTQYRATAEIVLVDESGGAAGVNARRRFINSQAAVLESNTVAKRASRQLGGGYTPAEIEEMVQARSVSSHDAIRLTAVAGTAEEATAVANAVVDAYRQQRFLTGARIAANRLEAWQIAAQDVMQLEAAGREGTVDKSAALMVARQRADNLEKAYLEAELFLARGDVGIEAYSPADADDASSGTSRILNGLGSAVLGFVAVAALLWRRTEVKAESAAAQHVTLPELLPSENSREEKSPPSVGPDDPS